MKKRTGCKLPGMLWFLFILLTGFAGPARAETFFVYIEELNGTDQPAVLAAVPAVKEGLLEGMFELGHIVFEDGQAAGIADWVESDFSQAIKIALAGGAQYLLAVKTVTHCEEAEAGRLKIEQTADYYFFDVEKVVLIKKGELARTNWEKSKEYDAKATGFSFGKELSLILNGIWEKKDLLWGG